MTFGPSKDSDQTGHPPSLIRVFAVRMKKHVNLNYRLSAQRRLIRLGECPGWSESLLGAQTIFLVLSWSGWNFGDMFKSPGWISSSVDPGQIALSVRICSVKYSWTSRLFARYKVSFGHPSLLQLFVRIKIGTWNVIVRSYSLLCNKQKGTLSIMNK